MPKKPVVFIVDDDANMRLTIEFVLEGQDLDLVVFDNGRKMLQALDEVQPDLILLDVMMPDVSGFDVCDYVRKTPIYQDIPIIMITALDAHEDLLHGFEVGADDFIVKPYNRLELRARVRMVTKLNRYRKILAAERRLLWSIEDTQEGYLMIGEHDQILYANKSAKKMLCLEEQNLLEGSRTFLPLARANYECYPDYNWLGWPATLAPMERARYLRKPESDLEDAIWLKVDMLPGSSSGAPQFLLRIRDVSRQIAGQVESHTFHRMINHKLRSPLVGMMLALQGLQKEMTQTAPELIPVCQSAIESAEELNRHILEIQAHKNFQSGGIDQEGYPVQQLGELLALLGRGFGIQAIGYAHDPDLDGRSLALSPQSVQVIFLELIENAVKYHPSHSPKISVELRKAERQELVLELTSTGTQIPTDVLERMWEPYMQHDENFIGAAPDMSRGLGIVSHIIWRANGKHSIQNLKNGEGMLVKLTIPLL